MNKRLPFIFAIVVLCLTILSYTQVDLNLTLVSWQPYLQLQNQLTQLGYFNRGLNTVLWSVPLVVLLVLYGTVIKESLRGTRSSDDIKKYLLIASLGGIVSYSVFSHDIFNYMFDARIFTKYNLNPYEYKALDFPQDEWTRFMHWTHRTYPYGPAWLVLTLVPSFFGFQKIILTLGLFKLLFVFSYIASVYFVGKILSLYTKNESLVRTGMMMVALHPLVIIDGLISPHLDITMAALCVAALYYLCLGKKSFSFVTLLASIGIKYVTVVFLPIVLIKNKVKEKTFFLSLICIGFGIVIAQSISRGAVQPWYFTTAIILLPLLLPFYKPRYIVIALFCTILPLWIYLYYLFTGEWKGVLWFI